LSLDVRPNPSRGATEIHFRSDDVPILVEVFDLRGQRIRVLDPISGPGVQSVTWDGRDARGHLVASGVYFVSARGAAQQAQRKLLLVR
jgi:hypothetical protein